MSEIQKTCETCGSFETVGCKFGTGAGEACDAWTDPRDAEIARLTAERDAMRGVLKSLLVYMRAGRMQVWVGAERFDEQIEHALKGGG